jgi:23S rRNA (cytidine2498-2'-O)-methyltransferase
VQQGKTQPVKRKRARRDSANHPMSSNSNAAAASPQRVRVPAMPSAVLPPATGRWLWTCRAGFEAHLFEELAWQRGDPRMLGPALVESDAVKDAPAFARVGFPVRQVTASTSEVTLPAEPFVLQVWAPDTDEGNRAAVDTFQAAIPLAPHALGDAAAAHARGAVLTQVCVVTRGCFAIGEVPARDALSLAPGGRHRMRRDRSAPSRAAMKVEEALEWLGVEPGRGEECVDLGAAPGGWTQRLVERGAKVIAVDPANLTPELERHPKVEHFKASAFSFEPEAPVDWLFCDMAWRPLEVAQLLGKWARRQWATVLVANFKLPMNDKNPMLWRIRGVLEDGGWARVKVRQLYHDRDEVTVTAYLRR